MEGAQPLEAGAARLQVNIVADKANDVAGVPDGVEVMALGDQVILRGAPTRTGSFQMAFKLGDARGNTLDVQVPVSVEDFFVEQARLLQTFLGSDSQPLFGEERSYLDAAGNANGAFDVGDVRAWLRRSGAAGPQR